LRRIELLAPLPVTAGSAIEFFDAYSMAADGAIGTCGALVCWPKTPDHALPPGRGPPGHRRVILVAALAGDFASAVTLAERYREAGSEPGDPEPATSGAAPTRRRPVYGLRGETRPGRLGWTSSRGGITRPPISEPHYGEFFDALCCCAARGRSGRAVDLLVTPPEDFRTWYTAIWRPWYAALWVEGAVLAGHPDAPIASAAPA